MAVLEAAQTAAEINIDVVDAGIVTKDKRPRGAGEVTLREALEQHVTQALDPRQHRISGETAPRMRLTCACTSGAGSIC